MYSRILKNNQVMVGNTFEISTAYIAGGRNIRKVIDEQACPALMEDPDTLIEEAKEEAKRQADLIIKESRLEAERIIKIAEAESLETAETYKKEAFEAGYKEGLAQGKQKYERLVKDAELIKVKAEKEYEEFAVNLEETAVRMILEIAKKVISDEVSINKENILLMVRQAFERCTNKENAILKVSSEDYDYVIKNKDRLIELLGGVQDLDIRKDLSLESGACVVETMFGIVDAGIETKFKNIQSEFKRLIRSSNN